MLLSMLSLLVASCGPSIYYLGEDYGRTRVVQVFYDEKRIDEPYSVIGRMTNDQTKKYHPEQIKEQMIQKARKVGADALVFTDFDVKRLEHEQDDRLVVKAKLLKFR